MHAIEKIFAQKANVERVKAGDRVWADVDLTVNVDLYRTVLAEFENLGGTKIKYPERVAFTFSINAPAPTIQSASNEKDMREFAYKHGIHLFDINTGVVQQVLMEAGLVWPGTISIATDSHATILGALGAVGMGVGAVDLAASMIKGNIWFRVPEIIKINIDGELQPGVMAKDVILKVLGELKQDVAIYKAIEYTGSAVRNMSLSSRMVLCNMAVELGAKTSYIQPDEKVIDFLGSRVTRTYEIPTTDPDFKYAEEYSLDVNQLVPQVACPHNVDNVCDLDDVPKKPVNQCLIGTCTGGRLEDLAIAAEILKGRKINAKTRLIVIPASKEIYLKAMELGYLRDLIEAGATVTNPGCGPCLGAHMGVLAPGEVCVTASNRNFSGRMGSPQAELYLASPATVAATAIEGILTNPRGYLKSQQRS
ncbi:MAG: 3-isopropylmalate dehydratase [Peptococcaceae bacterium BICA1-8]|nr:MAG: 3-isopropylmalate dehydratase [Peptococcaceae bacterium BICA1-8]